MTRFDVLWPERYTSFKAQSIYYKASNLCHLAATLTVRSPQIKWWESSPLVWSHVKEGFFFGGSLAFWEEMTFPWHWQPAYSNGHCPIFQLSWLSHFCDTLQDSCSIHTCVACLRSGTDINCLQTLGDDKSSSRRERSWRFSASRSHDGSGWQWSVPGMLGHRRRTKMFFNSIYFQGLVIAKLFSCQHTTNEYAEQEQESSPSSGRA